MVESRVGSGGLSLGKVGVMEKKNKVGKKYTNAMKNFFFFSKTIIEHKERNVQVRTKHKER